MTTRLRYEYRCLTGERRWMVIQDGRRIGSLFVWPHGGACLFDPRGSILKDLSTERGPDTVRRILGKDRYTLF